MLNNLSIYGGFDEYVHDFYESILVLLYNAYNKRLRLVVKSTSGKIVTLISQDGMYPEFNGSRG